MKNTAMFVVVLVGMSASSLTKNDTATEIVTDEVVNQTKNETKMKEKLERSDYVSVFYRETQISESTKPSLFIKESLAPMITNVVQSAFFVVLIYPILFLAWYWYFIIRVFLPIPLHLVAFALDHFFGL